MKTVGEIMTKDPAHISKDETVAKAAEDMRRHDVGALSVCDGDCNGAHRVRGILTDRDIVVGVLAQGRDPSQTTAEQVVSGNPITIDADASIEDALRTMTQHKVRRLPVVHGDRLVGMVAQADIATNLENPKVGDLVESISAAP
jgi:CBS domain-containing protein